MKVGRNDPCPCGSNKKYRKCCLLSETNKPQTSIPIEFDKKTEEIKQNDIKKEKLHKKQPMINKDNKGYKFAVEKNQLHRTRSK